MLDDATLDRVERVWGDTAADHWLFVEQVVRWKRELLTPAQREAIERLDGQVTALGELLASILVLARELRSGTIDRILEMRHRTRLGVLPAGRRQRAGLGPDNGPLFIQSGLSPGAGCCPVGGR